MTRIEATAVLAAPPAVVWRQLLDHARWPDLFRPPEPDAPPDGTPDGAPSGTLPGAPAEDGGARAGTRLESVTLLAAPGDPPGPPGPADRVGTLRECVATLAPPPPLGLLGAGPRRLRWTDGIADVHAPWLLELDVVGARPPFGRARLRVILVEGAPGESRLRLRLSYAPGWLWLLDLVWLRRAAGDGLRGAAAGLRARYEAPPQRLPAPRPAGDPIHAAA